MIADKAGCDQNFEARKNPNKNYEIINEGSHGKLTMLKGAEIIINWIKYIEVVHNNVLQAVDIPKIYRN